MPVKPNMPNQKPTLHANMSTQRILDRAIYLMETGMRYPRAAIRKAAEGNLTRGQGANYYRAMSRFNSAVAAGHRSSIAAVKVAAKRQF